MTKIKKTPLMRILAVLTAVLLAILVLPEVALVASADTITIGSTTYDVIDTNTSALTITGSGLKDSGMITLDSSSSLSDGDMIFIDVQFELDNRSAGQVNESTGGTVTAVTVYRTEVDQTNIDLASYDWQSFTDGSKTGNWRFVTENGVTYLEVVVTSAGNSSDIEGGMELTGTVSAIDWSNNTGSYSTIELGFGTASVSVQYNNPGSLTVEKSANGQASYNDTDKTYTQEWTVTLTPSSTGYVNVENFSDSSTPSGTLSGVITLNVNGTETTHSSFADLTTYLSSLYLTGSDSVTVTYSTTYSVVDVAANLSVTNTAEVTYNDGTTAADNASLKVTVPSVSKTSSTDNTNNTITYTITYTWDEFTGTAATDASYITNVSDTMTMNRNSVYSESISIPDLTSGSWTWNGSTYTWTYTYTYTPSDEQLIYFSQYTNDISVDINGHTVTDSNTSDWLSRDYISKSGIYDSTDNTITWTVTFTVPYAMYLSDVTIYDTGSAGTYNSGSASATLSGSASANLTVTGDGSTFTFSGYSGQLSKGDVITLTYTTTVTDPSQTSSTITYRNTATPSFPVPTSWPSPSQSETASISVASTSNDILAKVGETWGWQDGVNFTLTVNTNTLTTGDTVTITDQLSIPTTDSSGNTNYLYVAWQNCVADYGDDYSEAFGLTVTSSSGGTVTASSISSTGEIIFTVDDIVQGTSVSIGYTITFSNLLKSYIYAAYDDAIANGVVNPGFAVYNTATAEVNGTSYNTEEAISTTYYNYPTPTDELEKTAVYKTDGTQSGYDYVEIEDDTVVYTLKANEDGHILNGGDSLTLTDTLGSGLALWDESSVQTANTNGTLASYSYQYAQYVPAYDSYSTEKATVSPMSNVLVFEVTQKKTASMTYSVTSYELLEEGVDYTYTYDTSTNTITFNVPDGKSLVIVYYCEVKVGSGKYLNGELSNSATLTGSNSTSVGSGDVTYTVSYRSTSRLSGVHNYLVVNKQSSIGAQSIYGATFSVTPVDENGNATGSASTFTVTDDSNTVTLDSDTYYKLEEASAPDGYTLSDAAYYIYLQSKTAPSVSTINGTAVQVYNSASNNNYVTLTGISISMAASAELEITASNGGSLSDSNFGTTSYNYTANVTSSTSATVTYGNASWSLILQNLTAGTYTLTSGSEICTIVVATNGTVTLSGTTSGSYLTNVSIGSVSGVQAVSNTPNNNLTITKLGKVGNNAATALSGATFTLTSTSSTIDLTNVVVYDGTTYTTIGDGTSTITSYIFTTNGNDLVLYGLPDGDYTLTEDSAPNGYTAVDPITFNVSGSTIAQTNATVTNVEYSNNTFTITNVSGTQTAEIVVSKIDDSGSNLAGA
ncbi:MAG: hypothetical protein LIO69_09315, partial [Oscillospiraceae bacterium]|nr:hypothetical protein [Oscillospiraceae bacterium]